MYKSLTRLPVDIGDLHLFPEAIALTRKGALPRASDSNLLPWCSWLAASWGLHEAAAAYMTRAVLVSQPEASRYADLGDAFAKVERERDAVSAHLQAVTLAADDCHHYCRLGHVFHYFEWLREAAALYELGLRVEPGNAAALLGLADVRRSQGKRSEAIDACQAGLDAVPLDASAWGQLGRLHLDCGNGVEGLKAFERGLSIRPADADLLAGRGEALAELGFLEASVEACRSALEIDATDTRCLTLLLSIFDRRNAASDAAHTALALAGALRTKRRYQEAKVAYEHSLARGCDRVEALLGLADACIALAEPRQAISHLEAVLALDREHVQAHSRLAMALHLIGDSERAWDESRWFYHPLNRPPRKLDAPLWDGSPLYGRTVMLWTDQGHGDSIMSLRYARVAKQLGGQVIVECRHRALLPLVARMSEVDAVAPDNTSLPDFDTHAPLVLFPAVVPAGRDIPTHDRPYISVAPDLRHLWLSRLAPTPQFRAVGLSWSGNATQLSAPSRFIPLRLFEPLAGLPGIRFIALQHGTQVAEAAALPRGFKVERIIPGDASIEETAALMMSLDLVISVDTMIAHLAGALGRPVWTLLRYATNWRWRLSGDTTPLYPTMRLFRQTSQDDWAGVMAQVRIALEHHAWDECTRGPGATSLP